jgi:site-specific DNA recombinase
MKRGAAYPRVSSDDQRGNYSIPTQLAAIMDYAEEKGYVLVGDQYVDPETGKNVKSGDGAVPAFVDGYTSREISRPALDAALTYLETVGFDVLIVYCLDRLARDPYMRRTLEIMFEERGAKVEYVLGGYDDTPEGEVRKDLDATFAKWENVKRVERIVRGKMGKAKRGLFVAGRAPYGYRIDGNAPGGLVVDEEEAAVVRRIFHLYVDEGKSIRAIARILTDESIPNYSNSGRWGHSTVQRILRNTAYAGRLYYNKNERKGKRLIERSRDEWIEIAIEPIVDEAVFNQAQRRLEHNREVRRRQPRRFYLLSGMVFCAECGRPYVAQTQKAGSGRRVNDAQAYRHRVKEGHCAGRYISARLLEPAVWDTVVEILLDPENLQRGYEESLAQQGKRRAGKQVHLEELRQKVTKLEQQRRNLNKVYIDPDIGLSKAEYIEQRTEIERGLKEARERIADIERELAAPPSLAKLPEPETFFAAIKESLSGDADLTPKDKRKILELLHIKVLIGLDRSVRIEGWAIPDSIGLSTTTFF